MRLPEGKNITEKVILVETIRHSSDVSVVKTIFFLLYIWCARVVCMLCTAR